MTSNNDNTVRESGEKASLALSFYTVGQLNSHVTTRVLSPDYIHHIFAMHFVAILWFRLDFLNWLWIRIRTGIWFGRHSHSVTLFVNSDIWHSFDLFYSFLCFWTDVHYIFDLLVVFILEALTRIKPRVNQHSNSRPTCKVFTTSCSQVKAALGMQWSDDPGVLYRPLCRMVDVLKLGLLIVNTLKR